MKPRADAAQLEENATKRGSIKSNLDQTLFSCLTGDNKSDIIEYKPFVIIDLDKVPNVEENFKKICNDKYTLMSFISPSGNGIKILYELDFTHNDKSLELIKSYHEYSFSQIKKYIETKFNLIVDESGKNINRLCYLASSYEPYLNEECSIFDTTSDWLSSMPSATTNQKIKKTFTPRKSDELIARGLQYFTDNAIDAFETYEEWLKLGFIIYSEYGDSGLNIYHAYSQLSKKYNKSAVDSQWKNIANNFKSDKCPSKKYILKRMIDFGFVIKQNDAYLKKYIWKESDLPVIQQELGFEILIDELTDRLFYKKGDKIELMSDPIFNQIVVDVRHRYSDKISLSSIDTFVKSEANLKKVNFIKDKITSIESPDDTEFNKIFEYLITDEGKDLTKKILMRWMLGAMKNIFSNQYDEILSLKGGQGMGKTTWIMQYFLSPFIEWTSTSFSYDIKNTYQIKQLSDKMFIYDMENTSMSRSEVSTIKKITSMDYIEYKVPYARFSKQLKRIATFLMDTNEDVVFNDTTGGRRFLILNIKGMNIYDKDGGELKKIDYNKVWGYIYHLWNSGKRPGDIDISEIDKFREGSRLKSDLEDLIIDTFEESKNQMTFDEVKNVITARSHAKNIRIPEGEFNNTKIGRYLSRWKSKQIRIGDRFKKVYYIKERASELDDEILKNLSFSTKEKYVDDILDIIHKENRQPNDKEIEILKKLRK